MPSSDDVANLQRQLNGIAGILLGLVLAVASGALLVNSDYGELWGLPLLAAVGIAAGGAYLTFASGAAPDDD